MGQELEKEDFASRCCANNSSCHLSEDLVCSRLSYGPSQPTLGNPERRCCSYLPLFIDEELKD